MFLCVLTVDPRTGNRHSFTCQSQWHCNKMTRSAARCTSPIPATHPGEFCLLHFPPPPHTHTFSCSNLYASLNSFFYSNIFKGPHNFYAHSAQQFGGNSGKANLRLTVRLTVCSKFAIYNKVVHFFVLFLSFLYGIKRG